VNGDGQVLLNDYEIIRDNFRQSVTSRISGDLNSDGLVTFLDFLEWRNNATPAALAAFNALSAVPEPATGLICALVCIGYWLRSAR
jgi:hypothetical protein